MLRPSPQRIKTLFAAGKSQNDIGKPALAEIALRTVLEAMPGLAEAQFQLGRSLAALGQGDEARHCFEAALASHPKEMAIWVEYALLAAKTEGKGAAKAITRAAKAAGISPALVIVLGDLAKGMGRKASALGGARPADVKAAQGNVAKLSQLTKRFPKGALLWALLAQAQTKAGASFNTIEASLAQACRIEPLASDLASRRAGVLDAMGQVPMALIHARAAAHLAPLSASAQSALVQIAFRAGALDEAQRVCNRVAQLAPKAEDTAFLMGRVALAQGRPRTALQHTDALADTAQVLSLRAEARSMAGDNAGAIAAYDALLELHPEDTEIASHRAQLLQSMGETEAAETVLRDLTTAHPAAGMAWRALAYGSKLSPEDPAVAVMQAALADAKTPSNDQRLIHFALARVFQNQPQEFDHLDAANAATARSYPYTAKTDDAAVRRIMGPVTETLSAQPATEHKAQPIFVSGMPRSGTTLVEQILAAHPSVTGGGELGAFQPAFELAQDALAMGLTTDLAPMADAYVDTVGERIDASGPFTDKSIHTFTQIGLVAKAFPKGRVIVVHRDPRDVGLSIYRNQFADGMHRYASNLRDIARHYGVFHRMVEHWRAHAPGAFYEIRYEDLLADPEAQSRALIDAVGLDWDPACLSFHTAARRVDTLSFAQVRQPLYRTSQGGWRKFEAELTPLIEELEAQGVPLSD